MPGCGGRPGWQEPSVLGRRHESAHCLGVTTPHPRLPLACSVDVVIILMFCELILSTAWVGVQGLHAMADNPASRDARQPAQQAGDIPTSISS